MWRCVVGADTEDLGYAAAQFPMGWVLQRFPLGKALSITVILWGGMCMCLGACNNYWQLSLVRVLLGWFEAVVIPGCAVLTSSWYLRREQTFRQTLYFAQNTFFSIIFGVGIYYIASDAQARGGLAAWRVINLFLGGTTVGMGIVCLVFIGTPDEVWWLSRREKLMAKARIVSNATGGGEQHPWSWAQARECFRDPQLWFAVAANFLSCVPNGGLTAFGIIINQSFGFNNLDTILYSLPSYAITCTCVVAAGACVYYRPHSRFPIAIASQLWTCFVLLFVGFTPLTMNKWIRWTFYSFYGMYSICMFLVFPLMTVNVAGRSKKTVFGAMCLVAYCVGVSWFLCVYVHVVPSADRLNVVGSQIFVAADAPRYHRALAACAVILCVNAINLLAMWRYYHKENKRRDAELAASGIDDAERQLQMRLAGESDLTDKENRHFRYSC